jgi:hypothetical protein
MSEFLRSLGELLGNLLSALGVVGRPRRRAMIEADLNLFARLSEHEEFASGTAAHTWLQLHIEREIGEYSGFLDFRTERWQPLWANVFILPVLWLPLAWGTWHLAHHHHPWWAVVTGFPAVLFFLVWVSSAFNREPVVQDTDVDLEAALEATDVPSSDEVE